MSKSGVNADCCSHVLLVVGIRAIVHGLKWLFCCERAFILV